MEFVFYACSLIAVISTLLVIIQKNAVYSLLYLIISLLSISGIFFIFGAFFAGALEVVIYAGAIIVLFVFVIMMLNLGKKNDLQEKKYLNPIFWIGPSFLSLILFLLMTYAIFFVKDKQIYFSLIDVKEVGINLFGPYLLLVELSSLLLLSALVVVFHIGKEKK
ncbi:NADH-quinone oxidoreductase subunit J [Buchnera aphidicola]|jgi:NADH-quinone oxidoreductase subunit J|uniref:NADH-quinone oxidoreductase subunit J n=1 Tax=Buchnera aphidicola subsp. Schizaphis graminum (strain Sg) TaxID=198804 RepID=NUOJ_BUCAP|nr:NADH-quinone oxidoreductase subunit J [Buchnera aphidicola]Q8K9X9.1 RecName: Full=NADH-quinone oxidoreductase subunit J; AltName: Full=NADH dehydrogenase I subunit J; AltName: Full=NDH-1 subunit J [Buchnera aphidicola str. Sg (Schizaphis graminum)]AAM67723.1 NADH dehydrogenase I chain J [Buchnera aphidicola str. Sg (Schizaphis graminum)]AWI49781.1 NADH-quinone oxidoreductase subunit J [Buchnera aphidicola (Schizaphis graminum)]